MVEKAYTLKKFVKPSSYEDFDEDIVTLNLENSSSLKLKLFEEDYIQAYETFSLPKRSLKDLENLLEHFNLIQHKQSFLNLMADVQSTYIKYSDIPDDSTFLDFNKSKKEFSRLIDVLSDFLFNDKNELKSISFKFNNNDSKTFKNFFVIKDIYESILDYYGLDENNFPQKKEEVLNTRANTFDYMKGAKYVLVQVVRLLYNFLEEHLKESGDEMLRFCGVFLHISQIPTDSSQDIAIGKIEDSLFLVEPKTLRNYLNNRIKSSL